MTTRHEDTFPAGPALADLVARSLDEDVGSGDASTAVTVDAHRRGRAVIRARQPGVVAGLPILDLLFGKLDSGVGVDRLVDDGTVLDEGGEAAVLEGPAASLLTGERTALNFLQHLGGIATLTARYVEAVTGTRCMVLDTRKTLPGYRALAKYAVRCGGGHNHRMGLYDRIMLKDNHWASASGSLADLVARARREYPDLAIEVEVDDLGQFDLVLGLGVEWILLDNYSVSETAEAVKRRDAAGAPTRLESSGNVTLETIGEYARTGVDAASVGRLTHSAPALDLGMDMEVEPS